MTKKLGVTAEIPSQPAIALGAVEITVQEMVGAYSTFANQGVYVKPQFILKIEDKNGSLIYEPKMESRDVLNRDIAFAVVKLMEGVTEEGSGMRLRYTGGGSGYNRMTGFPYAFENDIAGKTGTTQNQSDGWFIGMVPNLATGVWVGCEDRSARFRSITYGQGAAMALPVWGLFMKKCYANPDLNISKESFEEPEESVIKVDCGSSNYIKKKVVDSTAVQASDEFGL
jgi:penicillin-binding protein 1A